MNYHNKPPPSPPSRTYPLLGGRFKPAQRHVKLQLGQGVTILGLFAHPLERKYGFFLDRAIFHYAYPKFIDEAQSPVRGRVLGYISIQFLMVCLFLRLGHGDCVVYGRGQLVRIPRVDNDGSWWWVVWSRV